MCHFFNEFKSCDCTAGYSNLTSPVLYFILSLSKCHCDCSWWWLPSVRFLILWHTEWLYYEAYHFDLHLRTIPAIGLSWFCVWAVQQIFSLVITVWGILGKLQLLLQNLNTYRIHEKYYSVAEMCWNCLFVVDYNLFTYENTPVFVHHFSGLTLVYLAVFYRQDGLWHQTNKAHVELEIWSMHTWSSELLRESWE